MGISINITFLVVCFMVFWLVLAIKIVKVHRVDDRFFFRQWLFPLQYWLQILFEKWTGNRRSVILMLQIVSLFATYFCGLVMLLIFSAFDINTAKHFSVFILLEYLLVSSIAYWFQPRARKVYKTK